MKGGDLTEIGEKGVNLSGGQKARISIARACYANSDIILMDDPVSALDASVKAKIFEDVILKEFEGKTRILVTHSIEFINQADKIIILENGGIASVGKFEELKEMINHNTFSKINLNENAHNYMNVHSEILNFDLIDNFEQHINPLNTDICTKNRTNIIEDENNEIIDVKWTVYFDLLVKDCNYITYVISIPLFVFYSYFAISISYSYGTWIENADEKSEFWENFYLSLIYPILYAITAFVTGVIIYLSTLRKSKLLHEKMLSRTINAPINNFFDTTTTGKILNRYSNDIQYIDYILWDILFWLLELCAGACFRIYIAALNSIWILIIVPILAAIIVVLIKQYIRICRELSRLENVNGSPLISHLCETFDGISTIRAFKRQQSFINKNEEILNCKMNASFWKAATELWFSIRINLISTFIFAAICIFCVSSQITPNR